MYTQDQIEQFEEMERVIRALNVETEEQCIIPDSPYTEEEIQQYYRYRAFLEEQDNLKKVRNHLRITHRGNF